MSTLYEKFNKYHHNKMVTVEDKIEYLLQTSKIIQKISELDHKRLFNREIETTSKRNEDDNNGFKIYYSKLSEYIKEYFHAIEEEDILTIAHEASNYNINLINSEACESCGESIVDSVEGIVCVACGISLSSFSDAFACSYIEKTTTQPNVNTRFLYKRDHYFFIKIHSLLGTNQNCIKQDIIDAVVIELYKHHPNMNLKDLTIKHIRQVLSNLGLQKYFEQSYGIIRRLRNGIGLIHVDSDEVEKVLEMADMCLDAFDVVLRDKRKNFLSYNYTIYKILELLSKSPSSSIVGYQHIKLLKKEKVEILDKLWREICQHNKWEFIETF